MDGTITIDLENVTKKEFDEIHLQISEIVSGIEATIDVEVTSADQ